MKKSTVDCRRMQIREIRMKNINNMKQELTLKVGIVSSNFGLPSSIKIY